MPELLPELNIQLENGDLGQVFKDKINALINALNENRTEFNNQVGAEETASQHATYAQQQVALAAEQVLIALGHKEDAEAAAIAANATVAGSHSHTKAQIGLSEADNTSDLDKPISTATQAALDALQVQINKNRVIAFGASVL